jgi:ubiquinone/menaquinone biosynthesis C-methylase UbiE
MPLADGYADFVFGVYVLHHVVDLVALFGECARVLGQGCASFVTASHDYIDRHPMNPYFPSLAAIDKARIQPVEAVIAALEQCGFHHAASERFQELPRPIDEAYVERVAAKHISTYELLPPGEFEEGLARLRADVARTGRLDTPQAWESTLVWAFT